MNIELWCIITAFQTSCYALKLSIKFDGINNFFYKQQNII